MLEELDLNYLAIVGIKAVATLFMAWLLFFWKNVAFQHARAKEGADLGKLDILNKLTTAVILILILMMALDAVGSNFATLWALGGIGGISLAFAAQDVLSNFFGGLMVYLNRPFQIGDWIRLPEKQVEGMVEEIGWYMTIVRNFEKRPLYIPNSTFSKMIVMTPSRMSHRQLELFFNLRYEDLGKIKAITEQMRDYLKAHPGIDYSQRITVHLQNLSPTALELHINAYTKTIDGDVFPDVKQEVLLGLSNIVHRNQADFAIKLF